MDPSICWLVAGLAAVAACALALVLGALRSYSLARLERLDSDPVHLAAVKALLDEDERLILGFTVLRSLSVVVGMVALTGAVVADARLRAAPQAVTTMGWVLAGAEGAGLGVLLFVALGGTVPEALGSGRAEGVLMRLLSPIRLLGRLLTPVTWFFAGLSTVSRRVFNVAEIDEKEEARAEILSAALAGESEGVIDEATMDVIENLMDFRDADVTEVMTPRIDIQTVDAEASLEAMLEKAVATDMSRLPVVDGGSVDKIVGILMVKDLLRALKDPSIEPKSLFRKPLFVPETKRVADLLKELRAKKIHVAIVADEYGGTAGLVSIEDLIEEIIGEIEDEHDKEEERPPLRRVSDSLLDVDAKVHIDTLNEEFDTKIPEDADVETLGGFIALRLGRIPEVGDSVEIDGSYFVVTEGDERRASRVEIRLP